MSKMDDIIRKTKEFGIAAGKKTGEVVDQTKVKLNISEVRSEIKDKLAELGMGVFRAKKSNAEFDDAAIISELDALYEKKSELENKLLDMKGVKKCPECSENSQPTAEYCQKCGYKF